MFNLYVKNASDENCHKKDTINNTKEKSTTCSEEDIRGSAFSGVMHFANYQASYKGNFIESLRLLSAKLKNKGVETSFCFPMVEESSDAHVWMNEIRENGNEVFHFTCNIFKDAKMIRRIVKEKNIRIVHVHFFKMKHILSIKLGIIGLQVKLIMHFHNHSMPANGIKSLLRQCLYKKTVMISCSDSVYRATERDYPENKKFNVDNGVMFDRLDQYKEIDRSEYHLKNDTKLLLMFGFDYYRKGVDLAIEAVKALNATNYEYELLVSVSVNMDAVKNEIVTKYGEIPSFVKLITARSDVASLYNMCDVFISPSREEGLPYSVLEALYCNCSTVVSDIEPQKCLRAIPYIVYHNKEDSTSLAEKIKYAISKKDERKNNIDSIRLFLDENYSLERWVNSIEAIYNRVGEFM